MNTAIICLLILILASGILTSVQITSGSTTQGKWKQYTDPYGRYSMEYPSKWQIQNEPVHSSVNEIPFEVSDFHNGIARSTISVQQVENSGGMNGREILSTFQNVLRNFYLSIQPAAPAVCGYSDMGERCMLGLVTTIDGINYGTLAAVSIINPDKGTFVVSYAQYTSSRSIDFQHVLDSFTFPKSSNPEAQTATSLNESPPSASSSSLPSSVCIVGDRNITLDKDIKCDGDGIVIQKDNVVINLNGFSIIGAGPDVPHTGIVIPNSDNIRVVGPGTVKGFQRGILISGSDGSGIKRVTFTENKIAVFVNGSTNTVIEQNLIGPNNIGVAAQDSDMVDVHANLMSSNNKAGISFVNTDKSSAWANKIDGSETGIIIDSNSGTNSFKFNNILGNNLGFDSTTLSMNNEFKENTCKTSNPDGLCTSQDASSSITTENTKNVDHPSAAIQQPDISQDLATQAKENESNPIVNALNELFVNMSGSSNNDVVTSTVQKSNISQKETLGPVASAIEKALNGIDQ